MPNVKTSAWDPASYLETEEDMLHYLNAALEEAPTPGLVAAALGDIARAKGIGAAPR